MRLDGERVQSSSRGNISTLGAFYFSQWSNVNGAVNLSTVISLTVGLALMWPMPCSHNSYCKTKRMFHVTNAPSHQAVLPADEGHEARAQAQDEPIAP
jgi:hypothetical protein